MAMFGKRPTGATMTGYGGGEFNLDGTPVVPINIPSMDMPQQARPITREDQGKMPVWKAALGGLFDSIAQQTGGQATFIPAMLQQRQQEREQQNAIDRWKAQYDYERAHPKPAGLTEQQRNYAAYQAMTPEERKQWAAYQDLYNPRYTNTPSGTQMVPRVVDTGAPPEAVQALHADPSLAAQFDQKYGPGASSRYLNGGGAGNGSGGFHIPSGNPLDPRR